MNYITSPANSLPTIGVGILSWHAHRTLYASLQSHNDNELFELFDEALIFFNEIEDYDCALAKQFGLRAEGTKENLGIMGGMKKIAELLSTDYVLHLENDLQTIVEPDEARRQLAIAVENMQSGATQCYLMDEFKRNEVQSGKGHILKKYLEFHPSLKFGQKDTLAKRLKRLLRPAAARRATWAAIYAGEAERFPTLMHPIKYGHWAASSKAASWTNLAIFYPRRWFLQEIISYAETHPSSHTVNDKPNLENELNRRKWWHRKNWNVGICDKGLFAHNRLDRPPHDKTGQDRKKTQ